MDKEFKLKQYNLLKFNTFKFFTKEENQLYDAYKKASNKHREEAKERLEEKIRSFRGIRKISTKHFTYKNQVSWFSNDLLNLFVNSDTKERSLIEDIIIIKVYHDGIFNQMMDNGFCIAKYMKSIAKNIRKKKVGRRNYGIKNRYIFLTAGAGQQRKENLTFISEKAMKRHNDYLMGGLSDESINRKGGINTGKLLSYKALSMSAGIPIEIPYEKIVVVPDFETILKRKVEFINTDDLKLPVSVGKKDISVNHMDGAGVILPEKINGITGNCQIRNKWVKGALVEFDFLKWAKEIAGNTKIKDIYNDEYDIEKDDIWVILTKSQFKASGYYENWNDYTQKMKQIGSEFYLCNIENPPQDQKQLSYQYLSTLDIPLDDTDAIAKLCQPTIDYIKKLHSDKDEALKLLGADEENKNLKPLQEALLIYPELLQDKHVQSQIKKVIRDFRREAKGGRILSPGYYSYIFPDVYAFCQRLFQREEKPEGIIPEGYVYNAYYADTEIKEVDLLRSPHLHPSEHCVRNLIKSGDCKDWLRGNATYVSTHDLAQLQMKNDVDGDQCFIATSQDLIKYVRKDCLPVYYKMGKADPRPINQENIKDTLRKAFEVNNIGEISNALTKYLSQSKNMDMNFIARLQAWNNFTIDYPKTMMNIALPPEDQELYEKLLKQKSPNFFQWAKNKKSTAVEEAGNGVIDRIAKYIQKNAGNNKFTYFTEQEKKFNPAILSNGLWVDRSTKLYADLERELFLADAEFYKLNKKIGKMKEKETSEEYKEFLTKYNIAYQHYRKQMVESCNQNIRKCVDDLIDIEYNQEYNKEKNKNILWNCFGWEMLKNIKRNIESDIELKARPRFAYNSEDKPKVDKITEKLKKELEPVSINIYQKEYKKICELTESNEKNLYYVLLCLSKVFRNRQVIIQKNSKKNITINNLNDLANITNSSAIIDKFAKNKLLKVEKNSRKIVITFADEFNQDDICFVVKNVWRPLVSLAKHEGKTVDPCKICGEEFIKEGNMKTCLKPSCVRENKRRNKCKNYENKKESKLELSII
ncbi:hypothetical protein [Dehalobacter sp. TeCB1]|jgi:hypothetical protein|uniref:hypothetical protein n=1 Tax=Dehalobacter sp. TeCB1 TaxID=1843715 RepID=UPI000839DCA3|nr:hypothetical protein [Dehalobacter sp. TeCB1]OCZ49738.1 hypothetical protein A7D23_02600 [Dehalobacter sp. TeCB1]